MAIKRLAILELDELSAIAHHRLVLCRIEQCERQLLSAHTHHVVCRMAAHVPFFVTTMATLLTVDLGTPASARVQQAVHEVFVRHGIAASDDAVMAEYVTVMMANRKGPDAVASELGELVGGALDAALVSELWTKATEALEPPKAQPPPRERSASPPPHHGRRQASGREHRGDDRWNDDRPGLRDSNDRREASEPREPRGRGRRGGMASDAPQLSIFGRAGIPDPHAPPFEPKTSREQEPAGAASLMDRLAPGAEAAPRDIALFPTKPTNAALCRFSTHCTNPMCPYSHPSPANAGRGGDDMALVLREDACEQGSDCTDRDCVLSHVSPAVAFVKKRGVVPPPAIGGVPCRFQGSCVNPACPYIHTDAFGRVVPPPAAQSATRCRYGAGCTRPDCRFLHPKTENVPCRYGSACTRPDCAFSHERKRPAAADRLAPFAAEDGERELVLPGGSGNSSEAASVH